jgi:hypothetical protein
MDRKINAAPFKARCLALINEVAVEDWDEEREVRNIRGQFDDPSCSRLTPFCG